MYERTTVITRKGQITIPVEIRRALGLKEGERMALSINEDTGEVTLKRAQSVAERTFGALAGLRPPIDPREERRAFEEYMATRSLRFGPNPPIEDPE